MRATTVPGGGSDPPGVVYVYAPGRDTAHLANHLVGFAGILQVDGYAAYKELAASRGEGALITLAFCWAHCRRRFYDLAQGGNAPLAEEALLRIAALYKIETEIRGQPVESRRAIRLEKTRQLLDGFKAWLDVNLKRVPGRSKIAEAMRYAITHWEGLNRFLEDGRIEIDSNSVERAIKPIALTRKNALFAGHDRGAAH